jgi:hypothetical protein
VNAPTRGKKERPTELPFTFSITGGEQQTKTVPIGAIARGKGNRSA